MGVSVPASSEPLLVRRGRRVQRCSFFEDALRAVGETPARHAPTLDFSCEVYNRHSQIAARLLSADRYVKVDQASGQRRGPSR